ncbi:16401_t:CDS:2, partial [Gigaspora margarita]
TKFELLHSQIYIQLKTRMTMKAIKELFDDSSIFIEAIKTTSSLRRGELSEEITGPFEFGKFREIEKHTKISLRPEEYKIEEFEAIIEGNKLLANGATDTIR